MGRKCNLSSPLTLKEAVDKIKSHLNLPFVRLALAHGATSGKILVTMRLHISLLYLSFLRNILLNYGLQNLVINDSPRLFHMKTIFNRIDMYFVCSLTDFSKNSSKVSLARCCLIQF